MEHKYENNLNKKWKGMESKQDRDKFDGKRKRATSSWYVKRELKKKD